MRSPCLCLCRCLADELPDGILLAFPHCELLFVEGFDSDILVKFPVARTGWPYALELGSVLLLIGTQLASPSGGLRRLDLIDDRGMTGSVAKVGNGIHDQCTILLAYFQHVILGDFSWVECFRRAYQLHQHETEDSHDPPPACRAAQGRASRPPGRLPRCLRGR